MHRIATLICNDRNSACLGYDRSCQPKGQATDLDVTDLVFLGPGSGRAEGEKNLPSGTKLSLTKISEIIIFGKLRISRVIPSKCHSFLDISKHKILQKLRKIILRELFS